VGGGSINQVTAWIDYNADGIFTLNERFMNQQVTGSGSFTFTPSINAITDSTLRMRIQGDFYLIGTQGPCAILTGGQAEDYSIRIVSNTEAPTASFSVNPEFSCDGVVQFSDESENVPTSWFWLFGDGEFSTAPSPSHTYTESGTYDVTLTAQNSFGSDDTLMTAVVVVDLSQALTPGCAVQTTAFCCGYGILTVNIDGTINASANASAGYEDFTCEIEISAAEGDSFTFSANTGTDSPQDVAVFIDFDNNGAFGIAERVFISNNAFTHAGTILIPGSVPVVDTRLRMRVISDFVGNNTTGCTNQQFGQAEDYTIVILPDLTPPTADFSASPLFSCDGEIDFMNASSGNSTGFVWYFGDGSMSTETDPTYTYLTEGFFTVSLVAINDNGQDSIAFFEYIEIDFEGVCDTAVMATNGSLPNLISCEGYLADDGGPNGNYSSNSNGTQTIETTPGNLITLSFISFAFQLGNDYLYIYDGPDVSAPLIGQYSGNTLPNGGTVTSTGNTITLRQTSNFFANFSGFLLSWECSPVGLEEYELIHVGIMPNPATDYLQIENFSELGVRAMSIIDLQGRVVLRPSTNTQGNIELEDVEAGNYILLLQTETSTIPVRFIVTR
jgi:PKD repeat protein